MKKLFLLLLGSCATSAPNPQVEAFKDEVQTALRSVEAFNFDFSQSQNLESKFNSFKSPELIAYYIKLFDDPERSGEAALALGFLKHAPAAQLFKDGYIKHCKFYGWETSSPTTFGEYNYPNQFGMERAYAMLTERALIRDLELGPAQWKFLESLANECSLYILHKISPERALAVVAREFPRNRQRDPECTGVISTVEVNDAGFLFSPRRWSAAELLRLLGPPDKKRVKSWHYNDPCGPGFDVRLQ